MNKIFAWPLQKTGAVLSRFSRLFYSLSGKIHKPALSVCEQNKKNWYSINGVSTLRVEYDLGPDSVIIDAGGYEGDWSAEISARYSSRIFIFEPVKKFCSILEERFKRNTKISIFHYGLSDKNESLYFNVMHESSSAFTDKTSYILNEKAVELVELKDFCQVMEELNIAKVDLLKINIEGGEYPLLEKIISSGFVNKIANIQVQFHDFVPDAENRMNRIKNDLAKTHELTYEYVFVWENWKRKALDK